MGIPREYLNVHVFLAPPDAGMFIPLGRAYPRGNFSVMTTSHQGRNGRSLDPTFVSASLAFQDTVRRAYALKLYGGVLSRLSSPLVRLDIFSSLCRPSQTAHLEMSTPCSRRVSRTRLKGKYFTVASTSPASKVSSLLSMLRIQSNTATTSCCKTPRGLLFPHVFARLFAGL